MANRRMLARRISQSKKVNGLPLKAQLVYTWTIPWLDDYGCYTGDPEDIKTEVFPKNKKISVKDINAALSQIAQAQLIIWFTNGDGKLVQQYRSFEEFQTFKTDRSRKSDYPQYEPENKGMIPLGNQPIPMDSLKLSKDKLSKDNRRVFTPPTFEEVKNYIKEKNYSVDAKKFFDYFTTGDPPWVDSKGNKVRNWKQKIITWSNHSNEPSLDTPEPRQHFCFVDKKPATVKINRSGKDAYICEECEQLLKAAPDFKNYKGKVIPKKDLGFGQLEKLILEQKAKR